MPHLLRLVKSLQSADIPPPPPPTHILDILGDREHLAGPGSNPNSSTYTFDFLGFGSSMTRGSSARTPCSVIRFFGRRLLRVWWQELENYMLDLRRQLQEAGNERATLLNVQRQNRTDMAKLSEGADGAVRNSEAVARELALCRTQLKVCSHDSPS
jgi:hypothetical protein